MRSDSRIWAIGGFLLAVVTLLILGLPSIEGYSGGVGDDTGDNDGCDSCHSSSGNGVLELTSSSLVLAPSEVVELTINVTETQLTDTALIGTFLMPAVSDEEDLPANDGWTIESDPNGNQNNYVELTSPGAGSTVEFNWTLQAPDQEGNYSLVAMSLHGGDGPLHELDSTGLTFQVAVSGTPRFVEYNFPSLVEVGQPILINATLQDQEGVIEVYISWLREGETQIQTQAMSLVSGNTRLGVWEGSLPPQDEATGLLFDITATDRENWVQCDPEYHLIQVQPSGTPLIFHTPSGAVYVNRSLQISFEVEKASTGVELYYRGVGQTKFTRIARTPPSQAGGRVNYTFTLPVQPVPGTVHYYLNASNASFQATSELYSLDIKPYMDLTVSDLELSGPALVGREVILTITLANQGTETVHDLWLRVYDDYYPPGDAAYVGWIGNLSIPVGEQLKVRVYWLPQVAGNHTLRVVIDANDAVVEADEGNNECLESVSVAVMTDTQHHDLAQIDRFLVGGLFTLLLVTLALLGFSSRLAPVLRGPLPAVRRPSSIPDHADQNEEMEREPTGPSNKGSGGD